MQIAMLTVLHGYEVVCVSRFNSLSLKGHLLSSKFLYCTTHRALAYRET